MLPATQPSAAPAPPAAPGVAPGIGGSPGRKRKLEGEGPHANSAPPNNGPPTGTFKSSTHVAQPSSIPPGLLGAPGPVHVGGGPGPRMPPRSTALPTGPPRREDGPREGMPRIRLVPSPMEEDEPAPFQSVLSWRRDLPKSQPPPAQGPPHGKSSPPRMQFGGGPYENPPVLRLGPRPDGASRAPPLRVVQPSSLDESRPLPRIRVVPPAPGAEDIPMAARAPPVQLRMVNHPPADGRASPPRMRVVPPSRDDERGPAPPTRIVQPPNEDRMAQPPPQLRVVPPPPPEEGNMGRMGMQGAPMEGLKPLPGVSPSAARKAADYGLEWIRTPTGAQGSHLEPPCESGAPLPSAVSLSHGPSLVPRPLRTHALPTAPLPKTGAPATSPAAAALAGPRPKLEIPPPGTATGPRPSSPAPLANGGSLSHGPPPALVEGPPPTPSPLGSSRPSSAGVSLSEGPGPSPNPASLMGLANALSARAQTAVPQPPTQPQPPAPMPQVEEKKAPAVLARPAENEEMVALEVRRQMMDATIAKIKEAVEEVRREGINSKVLHVWAERVLEEKQRVIAGADSYRRFLTETTEEIHLHEIAEAETAYRNNLESLRENMMEDRLLQIKRIEEIIRTGVPEEVVMTRVNTRNTRSKIGTRDLDSSDRHGAGHNILKRKRGQSPVSAYLQKTLKRVEMERDISQITQDDKYALHDSDDDELDARPMVRVRVGRASVTVGDVQLQKGDNLTVTVVRSDEHFNATLQSFNQTELFLRTAGHGGQTTRRRISVQEVQEGLVIVEAAATPPPRGRHSDWEDMDMPPVRHSRR